MIEVVQQEHRRQAVQQTSLANVITSCRRLTQIQWQDLFEAVSRVDIEFANDPAAIYPRMDFETRNRCRDAVEELARWAKITELDVAGRVLTQAQDAQDELARHVGYHLLDEGRRVLERALGCRVPVRNDAPLASPPRRAILFRQSWPVHHRLGGRHSCIYHGCRGQHPVLILLGILLLLPASELALQALNYVVTRLLPPSVLPKMSFKKVASRAIAARWSWCR